jgi:dsRNA-specific ribonuclease
MPSIHVPSDKIVDDFQSNFPYNFVDRELLRTALIVSEKGLSDFKKPTGQDADNLLRLTRFEELEFFGDKILGMLVAREVFNNNSGSGPGRLTEKYTVFTRNAEADKSSTGSKLYRLARAWGVHRVIPAGVILTDERERGVTSSKKNPLSKQNKFTDIAEALIGAVYEDCRTSGKSEDETQAILWSQLIEPHYRQMGLYNEADEIRSYASSPSRQHRIRGEDLKKEREAMLHQVSVSIEERNFSNIASLSMGYPSAERDSDLLQILIKRYDLACEMNDWEMAKAMIDFNPQEILAYQRSNDFFGTKPPFIDFSRTQNRNAIFDLTSQYQNFVGTSDFLECSKCRFDLIFEESFESFSQEVEDLLTLSFHDKHQPQMDRLLLHCFEKVDGSDRKVVVRNVCKQRFLETKNISLLRYLVLDAEKPHPTRTPLRLDTRKRGVDDMLPSSYDVSEITAENIDEEIASINDKISKKREAITQFIPGRSINPRQHTATNIQSANNASSTGLTEIKIEQAIDHKSFSSRHARGGSSSYSNRYNRNQSGHSKGGRA